MKNKENISFEDQWAAAFENAEETPPTNLWDEIEKELNKKDKKKPFLFFWNSAMLATGIAAALLIVLGYYFFDSTTDLNSKNISNNSSDIQKNKDLSHAKSIDKTINQETEKSFEDSKRYEKAVAINPSNKSTNFIKKQSLDFTNNSQRLVGFSNSNSMSFSKAANEIKNPENINNAFIINALSNNNIADSKVNFYIEKLESLPYQDFKNRYILSRKYLSFEVPEENEAIAKNEKKDFWFGMNSGISPFNTNVSVNTLKSEAFTLASNSAEDAIVSKTSNSVLSPNGNQNSYQLDASQPQYSNNRSRAINLGFNVGKKLNKKVSIESGIRFLRGTSNVSSNLYAVNSNTGEINSFVNANYLNNDYASQTIIATPDVVNSTYDYVSLPIQLSYEIYLLKNISASIKAGVSNDIFLKNQNTSQTFGSNTLNASNSNYKNLIFSGLTGFSLNYALSKHWDASFGSFLQQALNSGVKSTDSYNFRPRMLGLNYGVNYKF